MTDRDRLAADLYDLISGWTANADDHAWLAHRLIALGWRKVECWCPVESPEQPGGGVNPHCPQHGTTLDEERLARALHEQFCWLLCRDPDDGCTLLPSYWTNAAAAIAKAYREDTDARVP